MLGKESDLVMLLMVRMIMLERFWRQQGNGLGDSVKGKEAEEAKEEEVRKLRLVLPAKTRS